VDAFGAVSRFVPVSAPFPRRDLEDGSAVVRWTLAETEPGARFLVERGTSADGPFAAASDYLTGELTFAWTDPAPSSAERWYRLVALDRTGARQALGATELAAPASALRLWPERRPNPFRPRPGSPSSSRPLRGAARDFLDLSGRRVSTLVSGVSPRDVTTWSGTGSTTRDARAAAGIYFYRLVTAEGVLANRMVLTN